MTGLQSGFFSTTDKIKDTQTLTTKSNTHINVSNNYALKRTSEAHTSPIHEEIKLINKMRAEIQEHKRKEKAWKVELDIFTKKSFAHILNLIYGSYVKTYQLYFSIHKLMQNAADEAISGELQTLFKTTMLPPGYSSKKLSDNYSHTLSSKIKKRAGLSERRALSPILLENYGVFIQFLEKTKAPADNKGLIIEFENIFRKKCFNTLFNIENFDLDLTTNDLRVTSFREMLKNKNAIDHNFWNQFMINSFICAYYKNVKTSSKNKIDLLLEELKNAKMLMVFIHENLQKFSPIIQETLYIQEEHRTIQILDLYIRSIETLRSTAIMASTDTEEEMEELRELQKDIKARALQDKFNLENYASFLEVLENETLGRLEHKYFRLLSIGILKKAIRIDEKQKKDNKHGNVLNEETLSLIASLIKELKSMKGILIPKKKLILLYKAVLEIYNIAAGETSQPEDTHKIIEDLEKGNKELSELTQEEKNAFLPQNHLQAKKKKNPPTRKKKKPTRKRQPQPTQSKTDEASKTPHTQAVKDLSKAIKSQPNPIVRTTKTTSILKTNEKPAPKVNNLEQITRSTTSLLKAEKEAIIKLQARKINNKIGDSSLEAFVNFFLDPKTDMKTFEQSRKDISTLEKFLFKLGFENKSQDKTKYAFSHPEITNNMVIGGHKGHGNNKGLMDAKMLSNLRKAIQDWANCI